MTTQKKRNMKEFAAAKSQEFTIKDNSGILGHLRIKPNAIGWKPKGQHKFNQVSIEVFAKFADQEGHKVDT